MNEIQKPKYIETELGREKLCIQCGEYWPLDDEFWFHRNAKLLSGATSKIYGLLASVVTTFAIDRKELKEPTRLNQVSRSRWQHARQQRPHQVSTDRNC